MRQEKQGLSCSAESEKSRVQRRKQAATTTPNLDLSFELIDELKRGLGGVLYECVWSGIWG